MINLKSKITDDRKETDKLCGDGQEIWRWKEGKGNKKDQDVVCAWTSSPP